MAVELDEMKNRLLQYLANATPEDIIQMYEKVFDVTVENFGDDYFPCYVSSKNEKK